MELAELCSGEFRPLYEERVSKSGTCAIIVAHQPKDNVAAGITGAWGRLVVLNLINIGVADQDGQRDPDGLPKSCRSNMEKLHPSSEG